MIVPPRREIALSNLRPKEITLFAVALGLIVAGVGFLLDLLVLHGSHSLMPLLASDAITGALAGGLVYRVIAETRRKQLAFNFRIATLADLTQLAAQASVSAEGLDVKEGAKRSLADLEHTLQRLRHAIAELVPLADY